MDRLPAPSDHLTVRCSPEQETRLADAAKRLDSVVSVLVNACELDDLGWALARLAEKAHHELAQVLGEHQHAQGKRS
jgi:hypothetical protein